MTTHEGHDHPATKAGRAACRRGAPQPATTSEAKAPKAKTTKRERAVRIDPALPHEYDPDSTNPKRCYVCKRAVRASVHVEPEDPCANCTRDLADHDANDLAACQAEHDEMMA